MKTFRIVVCLTLLSLLTSGLIMPTNVLAAGKEEPASGAATYTVRPGDSLASIAGAVYGDETAWPAIYAANAVTIGPNPHLIRPGQQFLIPPQPRGGTAHCAGREMDAQALASYRGLSQEEVERLQAGLGMTLQEICKAPDEALEEALRELAALPRPDHPDEAAAFRRLQLQDEHGDIPLDGYLRAAMHMEEMRQALPPVAGLHRATSWKWLGPGGVGGRIRSIVISPTNPSEMWVGGVAGGIWKTENGGEHWEPVDDFMANLAVSTMVINPVTTSIMYAGTGEGFYNIDAIRGEGVFKSTDGGETWEPLLSTLTSDWYYVNRLTISSDGRVLLAATRSGIWRSTDGGASWSRTLWADVADVDFHPTDVSQAIAAARSGGVAYYSLDGGLTWNNASFASPGAGGRIELAYAPSNPSIVYASVNQNGGELWQSTDGGQTYVRVNTGNSFLGSQGWYANTLWVNPVDPNFVVVGGLDLWRSTDGGNTLVKISQWWQEPRSAHADHHVIVSPPDFDDNITRTVYFGNDGGIYRADDIHTVTYTVGWQELNNNLGITQFYGGAGSVESGRIIGGAQDNGTRLYYGGVEHWHRMAGGDGGFCAADPTDPDYFYGEYVHLQIYRSEDGGWTEHYIHNGISDAGSQANFIAPFILDPNNPNTMLAGGRSLWRSTDVKAATPSWSAIKGDIGSNISAIAVAEGDSGLIWVGHNNGNVYMTSNGTAATPTWTRVDTNTPALPNRYVTRITIDPHDHNKVYVTFGGFSGDNVYRTTDGGLTWTDLTGSGATALPDVPVRSLVINPHRSNWLYVGTEVGIFTSEDGGATWYLPQDGPANVPVDELFWMGEKLVAVTHGRGIFIAEPGDGSGTITIDKQANLDRAYSGQVITYSFIINNPNPTSTLTLDITDVVPSNLTFITATAGGVLEDGHVVWHDLTVPSYTLKTIAQAGFLVEKSPITQVVNTVRASSDEFAEVSAQNVLSQCNALFYEGNEGATTIWTESYDPVYTETHWLLRDDGGYRATEHYWYIPEADGWGWLDQRAYLTSRPMIAFVGDDSQALLHFWHHYDLLESGGTAYNGGRLEISVNGQPWVYIPNDHFIRNGYTYPLNGTSYDVFGGANPGGYIESVVDLSDYLQFGDTFQVRFTYRNEWAANHDGWYVDDAFICVQPTHYLTITKRAPYVVNSGAPITFTITVTNLSAITLTNLLITDTIPANASYVSGGTRVGNVVSWTVDSLIPLGFITRTFVVTATRSILNADYRVSADGGVEAVGLPFGVEVVSAPEVEIFKDVRPATAGPGEPVTYTIAFLNRGVTPATHVVITDIVPITLTQVNVISSGAVITPRTGSRYVWDVGDLAPMHHGMITITGVLSEAIAPQTITNTAVISCADDLDELNNVASAVLTVENRPPVADAGPPLTVALGSLVTLDGSGSYDPNGTALTYHWSQTGGPITVSLNGASSVSPTFLADTNGLFTFTLTVTDATGLSATDMTTVLVPFKVYLPLVLKAQP